MMLKKKKLIIDIILVFAVLLMSLVIYREISPIVKPANSAKQDTGEDNTQTIVILPSP